MRFALLALALTACATTPSRPALPPTRLPPLVNVLAETQRHPCLAGLQQVPATVIDVGDLRDVPYVSYASAEVELNVYGDPAEPAAVEVGTRLEAAETKQCLANFMAAVVADPGDRMTIAQLGLTPARIERAPLVFEVTPATAPDAYGAWWVSALSPAHLADARATAQELAMIAQQPAPTSVRPYPPMFGRATYRVRVGPPRVYVPRYTRVHRAYSVHRR